MSPHKAVASQDLLLQAFLSQRSQAGRLGRVEVEWLCANGRPLELDLRRYFYLFLYVFFLPIKSFVKLPLNYKSK